jgi:XTP/dITP diphosphohydrolase
MQLLIATHNPAKIKELSDGVHEVLPEIDIKTLEDVHISEDPEETGKTFEENALLKAKYYAQKSGLPTLADDGGIMIDALNGEPGVMSKRWLGRDATDQELIDYCLERMRGVAAGKRTARFNVVLCFFDPSINKTIIVTESIEGAIAEKQTDNWPPGFCYRAVFIVYKFRKFYGELSPAEHDQINHRLIAIRRLGKELSTLYHNSL